MPLPEARVHKIRAPLGEFPGEDDWSRAPTLALRRAQDGAPVIDGTAVRLLEDGHRLFVRFDCDDRDVWATHTRRNAPLWEEEAVELFLAPGGGEPRCYVEIQVNPLGTLFDALVANPDGARATMHVDPAWDAPGLEARVVSPTPNGWRVDIGVPWEEVGLGAAPAIWRVNFFRIERPRGGIPEFACWSPTLADPPDFHRPSFFGRLLREEAGPTKILDR